jgi:hypothetical protein
MFKRLANKLGVLAFMVGVLAWGLASCSKKPEQLPTKTTTQAQRGGAPSTTSGQPATAAAVAAVATPAIDLASKPCAKATPPEAPAVNDPNLFGYVRLREPNKALDRVAAWIALASANAGFSADALRQQAKARGMDLSQLRAGGNVVVLVWKPADPTGQPTWATVLPIKAGTPMATQLAAMSHSAQNGPLGEDLLLASDQATFQAATAQSAALSALADGAMTVDLQASLSAETIMAQYGTMARNQITTLVGIMGQAQQRGNPNAAQQAQIQQTQKILQAESTAALDGLDQVKTNVINVNLDPTALEISSVVTAKAGSTLETVLKKSPEQAPDLAKFIGGGYTFVGQAALKDTAIFADIYEKYLPQMLPPDQQATIDQFKKMMEDMKQLGPVVYAGGVNFAVGKPINMEAVALSDNPELMKKIGEDNLKASFDLSAAMSGGMKFDTTIAKNVRMAHGQSVDQVKVKITFPAGVPPQQAKAMTAIFGGNEMTMETLTMGKLRLIAMNHPIDALADRVASGTAVGALASQSAFEPGACVFGEIDSVGYMKTILSMMGGANVPAGVKASPVMAAAYHEDGMGYYRLRVPSDVVTGFKNLFQAVNQQRAGQPNRPANPNGPRPQGQWQQ